MIAKSPDPNHGVIRAAHIERTAQPVLVDCSQRAESSEQGALSVVPLMDGKTVAGLEIRCSCGSAAVIECVYPEPAAAPAKEAS